jgi:hypothetical protein
MATILELIDAGRLVKLDPALEDNELEHRYIYAIPEVITSLESELPQWQSQWNIEQTPIQQYDALLEIFCSGEVLTYGPQFKPLNHLSDGIWELKTADLRIFGWFNVRDSFIAGAIDTAFRVKNHNLYAGHANVVAYRRRLLSLDEPKFIIEEDPTHVVSSFNYP